jgi:hypothetical protein
MELTNWGKYPAKETAIPPPIEYPAKEKPPEAIPVHAIGEVEIASKICVA